MMFPRVYIDNSTREHPTGFLGAQRLIDCLKRTARNVPKSTGEPAEQKKDEYKHGADAFRGLATIVDQVTNENERPTAPGHHAGGSRSRIRLPVQRRWERAGTDGRSRCWSQPEHARSFSTDARRGRQRY
jgi:hypothetical protein